MRSVIDDLQARKAALSPQERRIVDGYSAFMDTAAIDAAGLAPAQPYLNRITGAQSLAELASLWGTPGYPSPVGGGVSVDAKEPTRYSVSVGMDGPGLPDRDYYLDTSEKGR